MTRVTTSPGTDNSSPVPLFVDIEAFVICGIVKSTTTSSSPPVNAVTAVPLFPPRSEKEILKPAAPSLSPPPTVLVATQLLESATLETVAKFPNIFTVGVDIFSEEAKDNVITSPEIASALSKLFEAMVTVPSVGSVLSNVT